VADESCAPVWRKSPSSGTSGCVEVAFVGSTVLIRDSKDKSGPHLTFSKREWSNFVEAVQAGLLAE
jgi:Domain of unknown function (DUF397)